MDAIRAAARRNDLPADVIMEVEQISADMYR